MAGTRGQQGVELLVIFATALAVFITFYGIFAQQYGESVKKQAEAESMAVADAIAEEMSIAARAGDGYSRRITYPTRISGAITYNIELNNVSGSVDISAALGTNNVFAYAAPVATNAISGEPEYASPNGFSVLVSKGFAYVENREGRVVFNQTRMS